MTVAETLQASREYHQAYRAALPSRTSPGDPTGVHNALWSARQYRQAAQDLDPTHTDPAWQAEAATHDHAALLAFYLEQLSR